MRYCIIFSFFLTIASMMIVACAESRREIPSGITLVDVQPNHAWLSLDVKKWGTIFGIHGLQSPTYTVDYRFYLDGPGPIFVNPKYDYPQAGIYTGKIILDREQSRVTVDLHKVVPEEGEPEKIESHPVNGNYVIDKVMKADPGLLPGE